MNQQDHDLMESVTADDAEAIIVPASPPRRDSMEDADSSLTRKRPRLDNGSPSNRTMPSDSPPNSHHETAQPAERPREMTIRSQLPSSSLPSDSLTEQIKEHMTVEDSLQSEDLVPGGTMEGRFDGGDDSAVGSPPVIALDDEEEEYAGILIEEDAEDCFNRFPFTNHGFQHGYMGALRQMIQHFQQSNNLDGSVLPQVSLWLNNLPDRPSQWRGHYLDKQLFWDEFALFVNKVLTRRLPFGDGFCDARQSEGKIFYTFLRSYVRLCARLLQVDAEMLSRHPFEQLYDHQPLSFKHLRHLHAIYRPEKNYLFHLLSKDYEADTREISNRLVIDFLQSPTNGAEHLFQFAEALCEQAPANVSCNAASFIATIAQSLGWFLRESPPLEHCIGYSQFTKLTLGFFRRYDEELQAPSKVSDVGATKELIQLFSGLLVDFCSWDEVLATSLAEEHLDFGDPASPSSTSEDVDAGVRLAPFLQDPTYFSALVSNAWRFKLLKKYVVKGRMELRVTSISTMDEALVNIWREYHGSDAQTYHPVMQYLAEFLLHERVIDYIISVDSHPQIISRSGNIVGFLIVTHRYSENQTDAIWKTVTQSQDPRVVSATLKMLHSITNLMNSPELLYFCTKLYDLPIEDYTIDILRFLRDLTQKAQQKPVEWDATEYKARPWNVCVRVIQDTSPSRDSTKVTNLLHNEACDQLQCILPLVSPEERHQLCNECAVHISSRSMKATGSIRATHILCTSGSLYDIGLFQKYPDLTRTILEELCSFVDAETPLGYHHAYGTALEYRLGVLREILIRSPDSIPEDLYRDVWDHTIGEHALNNLFRDMAWAKYADVHKRRSRIIASFFEQLMSDYVPALQPDYFTPGLFEFVKSYGFPLIREITSTDDGSKGRLSIRGVDLLWRMISRAPPNTIEDHAAKELASLYADMDIGPFVSLAEVEDLHVAVVTKCTNELLSTYKTLRGERQSSGDADDSMEVVLSDDERHRTELRFGRILLFIKLLLSLIRTKPQFSRAQRSDSKVEALEPELPYGNALEMTYVVTGTNDKQTVFMGSENTLHDLYMRLCHATGFTKINIFAGGQRLNFPAKASSKLSELGIVPRMHLIVQKAAGSETRQPMAENATSHSVFELTLSEHLDELFNCMDSDDYVSAAIFDFLNCFQYRERIFQDVMAEVPAASIFAPGRLYQIKYAAHALQYKLREQLRRGALDDDFLLKAVRLLVEAILNRDLLSNSLGGRHEVHLAAVLVGVLLEMLKERPSPSISSGYFSDEPALVARLTEILAASLKVEGDTGLTIVQSYAALLEASLHSRPVWEAFISTPRIPALHGAVLLLDPRKAVRESIVQSITSVCGGDLPSTSPLNRAETSSRFWEIISSVLPDAIQYPKQSEQLFDIADQVFRSHDEFSRNEASLRSSLSSWSDLLLRYDHDEFVGRDEIDYVVLGFTKLLLCCISSLKSFKKPLHAGPLMEQIFRKFLFVPKIYDFDDRDRQHSVLPVLESKTRQELYELVIALAEDRTSYKVLLSLGESLTADEESMSLRSYTIDRTNEIRSSTGYVGLLNPRAICYMNSLVTQLFMNVNFREFMLALNVADAGGSQRLLSETQKLFAIMQNTFRKSADPREFASCVRGLDSQPIDINIQMDADEFYNLLFDQWEAQMLSPEIKQQFRSFYGGQTVNQIKSKECEHVSERVESFFVVQCDVQGKANLQESLQAFVEGDVMEGDNKYKCESCGGKFVDAVKRTCLKDVPDNLIFHLKRFDFDLVDMRRAKINDLFAFPDFIDISAYNVDYLSDPSQPMKEDIFELVGVLVHTGTSENGHYYSYIRERPCRSGRSPTWVEFNDRDVDNFDHQTLPYHAYGGIFDDQFQRQQKQFSAYMLFYQRRTAIEKDHLQYMSSSSCGSPKVFVAPALESDINADNESFIREYSLHDPYHSKFVRQIMNTLRTVNNGTCSEDHVQEAQALHIVLEHLSQTICRQRNVEQFDETINQLRKAILSCPLCCHIALKWFASHESALTTLLLRSLHPKVRSQVRALLIDGLRFLREKDPALYGIENVDTDMDTGSLVPVDGILVEIVQRLRAVAEETWYSARGWDDFYLTLCQLSNLGHVETAVLLNSAVLEFCLKILSMHAHPAFRAAEPDLWRLVEKKKNIYNRLIELVYTLLSKMDVCAPVVGLSAQAVDRLESYDRSTSKFPLSTFERDVLLIWDDANHALAVLDRMIEHFDRTKTDLFYPGQVLKWMLQSLDARVQRQLYQTVVDGVGSLTSPFSDPYVRAALSYCEACPTPEYVAKAIDSVTNSALQLRETGGDVHLQFFAGLLKAQNEVVFEQRTPNFFFDYCLKQSKAYAIPLLLFDDDAVRKGSATHLDDAFRKTKADDACSDATMRLKFGAVRRLITDMTRRIVQEHEQNSSRSYMQPMITVCQMLVQVLLQLVASEDPNILDLQDEVRDTTLIQQFQLEVEPRLRVWALDEGTPLSTGETYENSNYDSESDEGPDLEVS